MGTTNIATIVVIIIIIIFNMLPARNVLTGKCSVVHVLLVQTWRDQPPSSMWTLGDRGTRWNRA